LSYRGTEDLYHRARNPSRTRLLAT